MIYTGIGSRETTPEVLKAMTWLAYKLASRGCVLRSGKAGGADAAFQSGVEWYCYNSNIAYSDFKGAEIYVPWSGFGEGLRSEWDIVGVSNSTLALAEQIHPAWNRCKQGAKKLHARNTCQILGKELNVPSSLVLFYAKEIGGKVQGGTATAVNLARQHGIPTVNMWKGTWVQELKDLGLDIKTL